MSTEILPLADRAGAAMGLPAPRKADQDRLDAAICVLAGIIWRVGPADGSAIPGGLRQDCMATPISLQPTGDLRRKRPAGMFRSVPPSDPGGAESEGHPPDRLLTPAARGSS